MTEPTCCACGKPTPTNELATYGRCEDCWAGHDRADGSAGCRLINQHPAGRFEQDGRGDRRMGKTK